MTPVIRELFSTSGIFAVDNINNILLHQLYCARSSLSVGTNERNEVGVGDYICVYINKTHFAAVYFAGDGYFSASSKARTNFTAK